MNRGRGLCLILALLVTGSVAKGASEASYDEKADAHEQINAAISEATHAHKNIVLDFGADWCGDCHALDSAMQKPDLAALIAKNFVVVKVDVGRMNKNQDLAEKYHIPLKKGIPALAVLDPAGKLLYAQDQGQFEDARHMSYEAIKAFFVQWKPKG